MPRLRTRTAEGGTHLRKRRRSVAGKIRRPPIRQKVPGSDARPGLAGKDVRRFLPPSSLTDVGGSCFEGFRPFSCNAALVPVWGAPISGY